MIYNKRKFKTKGKNMTYKGLLFDLDGVIVDTAKYHYIAWKEIADELRIRFTKEDNERLKGVSRVQSFEILLQIGNLSMLDKEKEIYCNKKNEIYVEYIKKLKTNEILPGVKEFLETARKKGYKIALGTASKNSKIILDRLNLSNSFDYIVDGNLVSLAKPDPEVFLKGAKGLGILPKECIVFEDAIAGIQAAHNGRMMAVGVGSRSLLFEAELVIDGFEGITIEWIEDKIIYCYEKN
jgi:beta-phosphoglucomutase